MLYRIKWAMKNLSCRRKTKLLLPEKSSVRDHFWGFHVWLLRRLSQCHVKKLRKSCQNFVEYFCLQFSRQKCHNFKNLVKTNIKSISRKNVIKKSLISQKKIITHIFHLNSSSSRFTHPMNNDLIYHDQRHSTFPVPNDDGGQL